MNTSKLPTDDLKKYGIIDSDNLFSKKLSADDIQRFLQGEAIIADNDKNRIIFQLNSNNTELGVRLFERDRSFEEIMDAVEENPRSVQYSYETELYDNKEAKNFTRLAFLMQNDMYVYRFDMIKDAKELTATIIAKDDPAQINIYKTELQKLQSFLQDKIDKYPEAAKQITENLNIVSNELNSVNSISVEQNQVKAENSEVRLDVNDPDLYQDVNSQREAEEEQELEENKKRGFRR